MIPNSERGLSVRVSHFFDTNITLQILSGTLWRVSCRKSFYVTEFNSHLAHDPNF